MKFYDLRARGHGWLAPIRDDAHQSLLQTVLEVHRRAGEAVNLEDVGRAALEAEARHLLEEFSARYHSHQRFWDVVFFLGMVALLQIFAIPIAREMAGAAPLWPWLLSTEAVTLIAAALVVVNQRPCMEPYDGDSVDALVQARLEGHPELRRVVKDRVGEVPGSPLAFYLRSPSKRRKHG